MTATIPSTAPATIQSGFTGAERVALAGFLAGYRGLTREAYALDLRQFVGWCRARLLPLFSVRRTDIETFARELEVKGRARATVTRRLLRGSPRGDRTSHLFSAYVDVSRSAIRHAPARDPLWSTH